MGKENVKLMAGQTTMKDSVKEKIKVKNNDKVEKIFIMSYVLVGLLEISKFIGRVKVRGLRGEASKRSMSLRKVDVISVPPSSMFEVVDGDSWASDPSLLPSHGAESMALNPPLCQMGDILPRRGSPLRSIVMVPYQKGKQSFKAAVSILKMIRLPPLLSYKPSKVEVDPRKRHKRLPAVLGRSQSKVHMVTQEVHQFLNCKEILKPWKQPLAEMQANLIVGNDYWWYLFGMIPYACAWVSFALFDEHPHPVTYVVFFFGHLFFHIVALHSVLYWHREMSPFRLIGAKAKFMIEVIPVIVAAALPHLLEFDGAYYALLLSCTTYFYTFAHFMHAAYDIGGKDVFLALTMLGPLSSSFPIENRNILVSMKALKDHFNRTKSFSFVKRISDFHLLLLLAKFLDINTDVPALAECMHTQSAVPEGYQLLIESMASAS
ncbi:NPL4-like protein 1 [Capsicum baccatum]|uniref:NPL4-like protein 1 n=1 Tax=Capsicum baccatum TaxID=33114 RepID=A0A2G2WMQ2_CAPBA|nr:NPL4-like protein 1 [Capsicum baccatum]